MQELGCKEFEITGWYGILAPPGTPPAIVQSCATRPPRRSRLPDVVETLATQGMEPRGTQPADFAKYMASELAFYTKIIKDAEHQAGIGQHSDSRHGRACPGHPRLAFAEGVDARHKAGH